MDKIAEQVKACRSALKEIEGKYGMQPIYLHHAAMMLRKIKPDQPYLQLIAEIYYDGNDADEKNDRDAIMKKCGVCADIRRGSVFINVKTHMRHEVEIEVMRHKLCEFFMMYRDAPYRYGMYKFLTVDFPEDLERMNKGEQQ